MGRYRVVIAPGVADVVRTLHPDLKRSVRNALEALGDSPSLGEPLRGELEGSWRYRVRRFRIVYEVDRSHRLVRVMAVGPRRTIYEALVAAGGQAAQQKRTERLKGVPKPLPRRGARRR